jgi:hypothetical protein
MGSKGPQNVYCRVDVLGLKKRPWRSQKRSVFVANLRDGYCGQGQVRFATENGRQAGDSQKGCKALWWHFRPRVERRNNSAW